MAHVVRAGDGQVIGAGRLDTLQFGFNALDRLYQTADGWVCIVISGNDEDDEVAALGKVAGIDLMNDPRFCTREARSQHDEALADLLAEAFALWRTAELLTDLHASGVPAAEPAGEDANHLIMNDPVQRRAGRVAEVHHPVKGVVRENAVLVRVSDAAVVPHRLAAELGRDTVDILAWAGYDEAAIAALRQRGAIRWPGPSPLD
jgi:crotonobetainyl-CoA:carnitine CoA-transferase CaiB-like acyl-CoA transferase